MSASLLRKGLELLETAGVSDSSSQRSGTAARPNNLLKKKKNKRSRSKRDKATIKGRIIKSALEEYQKHQAADHFKKNMQYMMGTHFVADSTITEKILTQNRGRKAKDHPVEKVKKKKPEGTVFTEKDFQRFEREYFGRVGTI
ncbi:active regulator of SIRT1 [Pantherophis guttatus]|uniref:Active regulator of SIRT1 n=1 Tax=Pantherophis guttatus TaxID=94885 RepID=A0A6P9AMK8_PANGU|nr:active regulator of SIRT1 [Pantherophis guttatus]